MMDDFFVDEDIAQDDRKTIRFCPTLYVFLGSSPAQIGWRLKQLQVEAYGDLPIFQHLWIDTDTTVQTELEPWLKNQNVTRTNIGNVNPSLILKNIKNFPSIEAWWPDYRHVPNSLGPGAKQARLLGRLGLFGSFTRSIHDNLPIRETLANATQKILEITQAQAVTNMVNPNMDYELDLAQVRVYIINSMCGGTGSGISFDVAYLLRQFLSRQTDNFTIIGVQLLPPIFEKAIGMADLRQKSKIKANAYSYLQDLDYLTETSRWQVTYPTMDTDINSPPFDMVYVVDLANKSGQFLTAAQDVFKMTSQALFLLSVSPLSGAQVSMLANTTVQDPKFKGKMPYLSSFSSAALIYPKERLLQYCSARLAVDSLHRLQTKKYSDEGDRPPHVTLIEELRLNPGTLRGDLRGNQTVKNDNLQLILAAKDPGTALAYITNEMSNDEIERATIIENIVNAGEELTELKTDSLRRKGTKVNALQGPYFAKGLNDALLKDKADRDSLTAFLNGIDLDEENRAIAEKETKLTKTIENLANLSKEWKQVALKKLFKRDWQSRFNVLKTEAINFMADLNEAILRNETSKVMKELYSALEKEAQDISMQLEQFTRRLNEVDDFITRRMARLIAPSSHANLFQLAVEVTDDQYFVDYYEQRKPNLDLDRVFADFINNQTSATIEGIKDVKVTNLARALMKAAETPFIQSIENAHILEEMQKHYGDDNYLAILERKMDNVIDYCHPFWRYLPVHEDLITMAPAYIGVEDAQADTIPQKYKDGGVFNIISTGVKDAIYIARAEHGVATWMLTELPVLYKAYSDYKNSGADDPLNIILEASRQDLDPDDSLSSIEVWAAALAFGYVTKRGSFYYYDEERKYKDSKYANQSDRIAQGREKAAMEFAANHGWLNGARGLINANIGATGIAEGVNTCTVFMQQLETEKASFKEDDPMFQQLKEEIEALQRAIKLISEHGKL